MHLAGTQLPAGLSYSTVLPDMDFETYSEAGCVLTNDLKWVSVEGKGRRKGLPVVGAAVYAMHPSTEILSVAYDLKQGAGRKLWFPGMPAPEDLFHHIQSGGLLEAHNSMFEYLIWKHVAAARMGWPVLPLHQLRCSSAKAKAFSYPGALAPLSKVVGTELKDKATGDRVIKRYCIPRNATKNDPRLRIRPSDETKGVELYGYNLQDIVAESAVSAACPDLSPEELDTWLLDQKINARGIAIDTEVVDILMRAYDLAIEDANGRVNAITGGAVEAVSEVTKMVGWLRTQGVYVDNLDKEVLETLLDMPELPEKARDLLEIRQAGSSAGAKKLKALTHRVCPDGRMYDSFNYYRAHTGRFSSEGFQLHNAVAGGPDTNRAPCCGIHLPAGQYIWCPYCTVKDPMSEDKVEWGIDAMESFLDTARSVKDYRSLDSLYGAKLLPMMASSMRGLVVAGPGKELICSDYSAIEAVILAVLAGEQWRIDLFASHGLIYEKTASDITGIPFEELLEYKKVNGSHHPKRKPFGKVPELASGYQGWIGAWLAFGAGQYMDEATIKKSILAWRAASPAIVELWGGQYRETAPGSWEFEWDLHGLEGAAINAVSNPGQWFTYRFLRYGKFGDNLYCLLPSGRLLTYHDAYLVEGEDRRARKPCWNLWYWGWNTNPKKGPVNQWIEMSLYGGLLTENATQAVARDILVPGMKNVENAGYPIVSHVHDEIISEIDPGFGSIQEYEHLMMQLPPWAQGWPIKAAGGWRGKRYRKD